VGNRVRSSASAGSHAAATLSGVYHHERCTAGQRDEQRTISVLERATDKLREDSAKTVHEAADEAS